LAADPGYALLWMSYASARRLGRRVDRRAARIMLKAVEDGVLNC
jgi:hypothetical protein